MTELERARAHLREAQECLGSIRRSIGSWGPNYRPGVPNALRTAECCVLAALSWLWEEQSRTDGDYVFPRRSGNPDLGFGLE